MSDTGRDPKYPHDPFVWIDLETTGLDLKYDRVLEVGLVATDHKLNPVENLMEFHAVIEPSEGLDICSMNEAVVTMHANSGLLAAIASGKGSTLSQAEGKLMTWLSAVARRCYESGASPKFLMAGNTVGQFDRQFFFRDFPDAERFFGYRVLDVSSLKETVRREFGSNAIYGDKQSEEDGIAVKAHRVLPDIAASMSEYRYYVNNYMGGNL